MYGIWERYFFRKMIGATFFFLFTFYGLYTLIDYANHAASLHKHHIPFSSLEVLTYYASEFVRRLNILLPFALLLATIRTLSNLNANNELIALLSSGISLQRLVRPFVVVGLVATLLVYLNTELLTPTATDQFKKIEASRAKKSKRYLPASAQHIDLEDRSILLFQNFDQDLERFFDVYWIRNTNEIYRIKYLYPHIASKGVPEGLFVDYLVRNDTGELTRVDSVKNMSFPAILFNQETLFETLTAPEELSLSELWEKLPHQPINSEKESQIVSAYYHKMIMPWFCLLAVLGPAPYCLQVTRHLPLFFIYAGSIFGFVVLDLTLNASVVLAKRQVLAAMPAIVVPFLLIFSAFVFRFFRKI